MSALSRLIMTTTLAPAPRPRSLPLMPSSASEKITRCLRGVPRVVPVADLAFRLNGKKMCMNIYDVRLQDEYPACGMNWPPDLTEVYAFLRVCHAVHHLPSLRFSLLVRSHVDI